MVVKQRNVAKVADESETTRLLRLDKTPWYKKPNLCRLYLCLVPAVLGVEMTSGYDGSVLNGLQAVGPWLQCMSLDCLQTRPKALLMKRLDFNHPGGALLGVINAAFNIGSVIALPIVPYVSLRPRTAPTKRLMNNPQ